MGLLVARQLRKTVGFRFGLQEPMIHHPDVIQGVKVLKRTISDCFDYRATKVGVGLKTDQE